MSRSRAGCIFVQGPGVLPVLRFTPRCTRCANDCEGLARLCGYGARPRLSEQLSALPDGRLAYRAGDRHSAHGAALLSPPRSKPSSDVRVSHFSLDFLGALPLAPMTVRAEIARPGKRIELATATAIIDGRPALRAAAWRVAIGAGRSPRVGLDEAPPPMPDHESRDLFEGVPTFGYGESLEWRFASGGFRVRGSATVWSRIRIPLVLGEAPSPLVRLLAMVDSANGVSWEADFFTHMFVPVNLTVAITRSPEGE